MIQVVCGVIENVGGEFLACLRPPGKHLGGFWEFPGGKIDPGESPEVALARELREELDVLVEVGPPLRPVDWDYGGNMIRLLPFRCKILQGEPRAVEHEKLQWCPPRDFHRLEWAAADVPILDQLLARVAYESAN